MIVDTKKAVPEIIAILHKYQIPLALIPQVFHNVQREVEAHTIPYNPSLLRSKDLATSAMTDKVTEPKG